MYLSYHFLGVSFGWSTFFQCCSWKQQQVHLKLVKFYWKLYKIGLACSVWSDSIICVAAPALRNSVLVPTAALTQACRYLLSTIKMRSTKQGLEWTNLCTEELTTSKWKCAVRAKLCSWEKNNLLGFLINISVFLWVLQNHACGIFERLYGGVWQMEKDLKRWGWDKQMEMETVDVLWRAVRLNSP